MYDVVYIFRGILIGLMVSVPLGPMGVLIIQKTLQKGALAGFVAGMGAACADLFYATVAAFGLGFVINVIQTHELILQIIGGIFLIIVGLKIYFDNPLKQIRMKKRGTKKGLLGDFLTLFFLTVSNPVAIVVFMAVFAGASVFGDDPSYRIELFVLSGVVYAFDAGEHFPEEIPASGIDHHQPGVRGIDHRVGRLGDFSCFRAFPVFVARSLTYFFTLF